MTEKSRFRTGKIIVDMFHSKTVEPRQHIVLLYGMLSNPPSADDGAVQTLIKHKFAVWCPHYEGTFASDGVCTFDNAVESVICAVKLMNGQSALELFREKTVTWNPLPVILAGSSFGASVALVAGAKIPEIKNIVALAGPSDFRKQTNIKRYYGPWKNGWKQTWRISAAAWSRVSRKSPNINPILYSKKLREKNILLIHAIDDPVVNIAQSQTLYDALREGTGDHKLIKLQGSVHLGIADIAHKKIIQEILAVGS
ncbi:MAG: prolyl oligopeptidase family serine peptidase [Candidatus Aenigmarchaeota archaeon]|nr:prolyl oligopeptidase family serine peptidase [Candidatus Aenigmarchaeota archaeon]